MTRPTYSYDKVNNRKTYNPVREQEPVDQMVSVDTFEEEEETPVEPPKPEPKQGTVYKCQAINLRSKPSLESEVLTRLHKGDIVQVEGEEDGWFAVTTQMGVEGYLVKDYVEV